MSRFIFPVFCLLLSCSRFPPHAVELSGRISSPQDTMYVYRQIGLERISIKEIPLKPSGDSMELQIRIDSLERGWYFLGLAPNALTTVLLVPGEQVKVSGSLSHAGLYLKPPAAQSRWGQAANEFVVKSSAVEAATKVAMTNYNNGEEAAYADYANLVRTEYRTLLAWLDSLTAVDPYLAIEYELRLIPPYLPEFGGFSNEDAFTQQDAYWQALLDKHGQEIADFPGLIFAYETWMNLQYRQEPWATSAERARRTKEVLTRFPEGSLLHQNMLAAAVSVFDAKRDFELIWLAEEYLRLYPGNRRMQSFLEGRIRLLKEEKRYETEPVPVR